MSTSTAVPRSSATLVGIECAECKTRAFPLADLCSNCLSARLNRVELPQNGVLYASSIIHAGPKNRTVPYGVGYVDLDGNVRVFVQFDPSHEFAPGDQVHLHVDSEGVPVAEPAAGA
jgi:uncharacterized OB-fold protein